VLENQAMAALGETPSFCPDLPRRLVSVNSELSVKHEFRHIRLETGVIIILASLPELSKIRALVEGTSATSANLQHSFPVDYTNFRL